MHKFEDLIYLLKKNPKRINQRIEKINFTEFITIN